MTEQSTIHFERTSPQVAKITFANPPVNLIVGETVVRLVEIVDELADRPRHPGRRVRQRRARLLLQPLRPRRRRRLPSPRRRRRRAGVDRPGARSSPRPPTSPIASIRGRTRGGGNELALAFDLRYASRGEGDLRAARGRQRAAARRRRHRAAAACHRTGPGPRGHPHQRRLRRRTRPSDGAGSPEPCPTPSSTRSSRRSSPGWRPSTAPRWPPPRPWSTGPCSRRTPTSSPPTASSRTRSPCPGSSPAPQAQKLLVAARPASTSSTGSASTSASPTSNADTATTSEGRSICCGPPAFHFTEARRGLDCRPRPLPPGRDVSGCSKVSVSSASG